MLLSSSGGPSEVLTLLCCAHRTRLEPLFQGTVLWRQGMDRLWAADESTGRSATRAGVDLVIVDHDLPWAATFVRWIRQGPEIRGVSLAVVSHADQDAADLELLQLGANAVLRPPSGPEWDKRLARLLNVPSRYKTRLPVHFQVAARLGDLAETKLGVVVNLSESGMLLEGAGLVVGEEAELAFQLPGRQGLLVARARVVRQGEGGRFGLEFIAIGGDDLAEIQDFLRSLTAPARR